MREINACRGTKLKFVSQAILRHLYKIFFLLIECTNSAYMPEEVRYLRRVPDFKFVVDKDAPTVSIEQLCFGITGMTIDELADRIVRNRNGEFDALYEGVGR